MRRIALVLLLCVGCATTSVQDISRAVGKPVSVEYADADGWETIGDGRITVRLHWGWQWEPSMYHAGAIAGLACRACDADAEVVADRLGLPSWAMWTEDNKRLATAQQARVEGVLPASSPWAHTAPGWPTHLYKRGTEVDHHGIR
jgi:hypothetical protein